MHPLLQVHADPSQLVVHKKENSHLVLGAVLFVYTLSIDPAISCECDSVASHQWLCQALHFAAC